MKKIVVIAAASIVLGWFFFLRAPRAVGMRADETIDVTRAPVASATNRPSFKFKVGDSPLMVTVSPEADYEASGLVLSVNRPWGSADATPGTIVLVWGSDARSLLDPKTKLTDIKPGQGIVAVGTVTADPNLQHAVARVKAGQRVRVKGYRARIGDGSRVLLQSGDVNGIHQEAVYVTEIQADDTVYVATTATPPST